VRTKRIVIISLVLLTLAILAVSAWYFMAGLRDTTAVPAPEYWPTDGWRTAYPESQGIDSTELAVELQSFRDQDIAIDSMLIVRNGYIVLDAYYSPYDGSFPHDMASVSKSVTGILVGIAIDQGKIQLDSPMVSFFPDRTIANLDDWKQSITVRDLVSMRNGMESQCLEGDEPTLDAMRSQSDWVQAALDRKMVSQPGTEFCYDSPGMHILSAILQKATGMTELDFARQTLFEPLGLWIRVWLVGFTRRFLCRGAGWPIYPGHPFDKYSGSYYWRGRHY
jgi:CubicO group peptidase (beta-lactamase class C family)